ncbi:MAG TPA: 3-hydroxyacyl-CoA dehydrogenase family protein [Actinotalea caeni]|uniref:3-hydroxyacyl-CoA dehydrogenase family protein n=1 Tax=Actinotalea caeni TaxID=1348467 RepID=UPI002B4AD6A0|nr:3-hydroxyacyl-CoA dehydrogenase family protein [Actinotalea caeni]HLV55857.1 3-hydroxyacyl-CoA dehydrogenase family protein [Actinotalea caeni]
MVERIEKVAVIGAGYMGTGIAQRLAAAGVSVTVTDATPELAEAGRERALRDVARDVEAGLLPAGTLEAVEANLAAAATLEEAVRDADFVEEVVPEVLQTKRDVLARISAAARADAIIGSNTSTIPVRRMADAVERPERFLVVHWSNPAHLVPGVELVVGEATDRAVLAPVKEMLARADWVGAVVGDAPGFVLNRLQYALVREALLLVEEGHATAADVDTVLRTTLGFRMPFIPPIAMLDMAGLDVYEKCFGLLEAELGSRFSAPAVLTEAVADGRHGMKNGRGLFRDYPPETLDEIAAWRARAYTGMSRLLRELGPMPGSDADPRTTDTEENPA